MELAIILFFILLVIIGVPIELYLDLRKARKDLDNLTEHNKLLRIRIENREKVIDALVAELLEMDEMDEIPNGVDKDGFY